MRYRLRQTHTLEHSFTEGRNFAVSRFEQRHPFKRKLRQSIGVGTTVTMDPQVEFDELASGRTTREGVELRAIADLFKQGLGLVRRNAEKLIVLWRV